MITACIHAFILSLGLILPIGMQNGFILTQGALHRRWAGSLPSVVTASVCDTFLIGLAVIGVSAVALHVGWVRYTLGAVGVIFLLYMGWSALGERSEDESVESASTVAWTARRQIGFSASVSLLNPHALIDTLAVIGGSASAYTSWAEKIAFGVACAAVSWMWFFGLAGVGHMLCKAALQNASLMVLNRISAVMMWASAVNLTYLICTFK